MSEKPVQLMFFFHLFVGPKTVLTKLSAENGPQITK